MPESVEPSTRRNPPSGGFADLHTESYRRILEGNGFGTDIVKPSIDIMADIRNSTPVGLKGNYHPMLEKYK